MDNLRASPFLLNYIKERIQDYKNAVIVAKSPGVMHKVRPEKRDRAHFEGS